MHRTNIFTQTPNTVFTVFSDMILPLGISFYTFQTLGYVIDVYRGKVQPEKHLGKFVLFVSFFPQLIAGPIERARSLLPQFSKPREFNYEYTLAGLQLLLWGFFKKLVIADRIATIIDPLLKTPSQGAGWQVIIIAILFYMQIYCDFSGYVDIARGSANMLGIELTQNFRYPYMATSVRDFWRRWNITLSNWFRDYLYIPLGGNRINTVRTCINVLIVFFFSGMWHGTGWNFLVWGLMHGVWICLEICVSKMYTALKIQSLPTIFLRIQIAIQWIITFLFTCLSFLLFRSDSLENFASFIQKAMVFTEKQLLYFVNTPVKLFDTSVLAFCMFVLICSEIIIEKYGTSAYTNKMPNILRWCVCTALLLTVLNFGIFAQEEFIYFQF